MAYSKDIDYQAKIDEAVAKGDYASASAYEKKRNEKIEKEGLSYQKTNNYDIPNGVDGNTYNQYNKKFSTTDKYASLETEKNNAASKYKDIISTDNIISNGTKNAINKGFRLPSAVSEADAYLSAQLQKIQSGKTSYSDQVRDMMDKITNREKFSYDVDADPLFQQALSSAMNSGKQAMQDNIGQASALTGGYGSTYATSAGNQAYNAFIEDAYDNLPQYYQMAMEAYQMEGDEMYRQFSVLSELDDKEYNRNVTAYDATYQHRNQLYNEAYAQYRDNKSDAFAMANLELNEYGQRANDAYNYYNIASTEADKQYAREYTSWADSINQAWQMMQMQNSDWWNQTNFDENVRQYEKSFAEEQRQFNANLAEQQRQHNETMAYNYASLAKRGSGGSGGSGGSDGLLSLFANEAEANKAMQDAAKSKPVSQFKSSILKENEFNKRGKKATSGKETVQYDNYQQYVEAKLDEWYNNGKGKLSTNQYIYLANLEW